MSDTIDITDWLTADPTVSTADALWFARVRAEADDEDPPDRTSRPGDPTPTGDPK